MHKYLYIDKIDHSKVPQLLQLTGLCSPISATQIPKFTLEFSLAAGDSTGNDQYITTCMQHCRLPQSHAALKTMELPANTWFFFPLSMFCLFQNIMKLEACNMTRLHFGFSHLRFLYVCSHLNNSLLSTAWQTEYTNTHHTLSMHASTTRQLLL